MANNYYEKVTTCCKFFNYNTGRVTNGTYN